MCIRDRSKGEDGTSTIKATMPINSNGAVSPNALAIPIMVPVIEPGNAKGTT